MIIHYNKITSEHRSLVRSMESKGYIGYIRYLLLKRWPFERIRKELMRLGLAWNEKEDFHIYFKEVLYPVIQKHHLKTYYKTYRKGLSDDSLSFAKTFKKSETDRARFVDLLNTLEIEQFFAEEVINYYGGASNIPNHPETGEPLFSKDKPVDLVNMLQNPKRYQIEDMLVEGYTGKQISDSLYQRYDMDIPAEEVNVYARSFFNVKRQDLQRLLDSLQDEKEQLDRRLIEIRNTPPEDFSVGERFEVVSKISGKIAELNKMIRKLSGVHTNASFNAGVLEAADMREMFSDVMIRSHRRFRDMDERTEDAVVGGLKAVVDMMSKASKEVMSIDEVLNTKASKSIREEMLDVIMPTLDRIEQEEREATYAYRKAVDSADDDEDEDDEIMGFD